MPRVSLPCLLHLSSTDPWVKDAVAELGGEQGYEYHDRDYEEHRLRKREVVVGYGLEYRVAQSVPLKDGLGDDGAGENEPDGEGERGHYREHRVAEGVFVEHRRLRDALRPGHYDVVFREGVDHDRALGEEYSSN